MIQEANRWTNVLKTRTAAGLGVAAETSGVVMESATKTFSSWRGRKKTTRAGACGPRPQPQAGTPEGSWAVRQRIADAAFQRGVMAERAAAKERRGAKRLQKAMGRRVDQGGKRASRRRRAARY